MTRPIANLEFVHGYLAGVFAESLHAKRIQSLAGGALEAYPVVPGSSIFSGCPISAA